MNLYSEIFVLLRLPVADFLGFVLFDEDWTDVVVSSRD